MPIRSIKRQIRTPLVIAATAELLILFSSVFVAGLLVMGGVEECLHRLDPITPKAVAITLIAGLSLASMGLYQFHQRLTFADAATRIVVGLGSAFAGIAAVFYLVPALDVNNNILLLALAYSLTLLLMVRLHFVRSVDENVFRRSTLVYGAGKRAASISELRRKADRRGFRIVGKVAAPGDDVVTGEKTIIGAQHRSIADIAVEMGAEEIVVAMDDSRGNLPVRELLDARFKGIDVIDLLQFLERETGKIRVDLVKPSWLIFSPGFRISKTQRIGKRTLDVMFCSVLLALSWPLMILIALAIKAEDGLQAPVLYKQARVGRDGEDFDVLKFRSMRINAEADGKAVWAAENDERVTRVGAILRKMRFDELPQIFNVLGGSMSIVGPRPERPEFVRELQESIPYYAERHVVKPGVTGWAQLKYSYGGTKEDAVEKLQYELYYIKNHTLMLDIAIFIQTVEVVLWGKGAR